jgi:hypothetical protein
MIRPPSRFLSRVNSVNRSRQRGFERPGDQAEAIPGEIPRSDAQRHPRAQHSAVGAVHPQRDHHRYG